MKEHPLKSILDRERPSRQQEEREQEANRLRDRPKLLPSALTRSPP